MSNSVIVNPSWTSLVLQNLWQNYANAVGGSWAIAEYRKTQNLVELRGLITINSTPSFGSIIANLPIGFRPDKQIIKAMPYAISSSTGLMRVDIDTTGNIIYNTPLVGTNGNILYLDLQMVFGV